MPQLDPASGFTSLNAALTSLFLLPDAAGHQQWGDGVARAVGNAVCATRAALVIKVASRLRVYGDGVRGEVAQTASSPANRPDDWAVPASPLAGAWCRRATGTERDSIVFDALPIVGEVYDAVGLSTAGAFGGRASVVCLHETPPPHAELHRHVETLTLLCPAVAASVRSHAEAARERRTLTRLLDALTQGVTLYDADGRVLHRNPAFTRLLDGEPERDRLARACAAAARAVISRSRPVRFGSSDEMACPELRQVVRTGCALYALQARLVASDAPPAGGTVAVTIEPAGAAELSATSLRKRFGLTERELDVTQLLSAGKSNTDIALALGISPYTARHHTESVLSKLGVHSRAEVPRVVLVAEAAAQLVTRVD